MNGYKYYDQVRKKYDHDKSYMIEYKIRKSEIWFTNMKIYEKKSLKNFKLILFSSI